MVIRKFLAIGIFVFLNLILLSFASGAAVAAWKDSYCADCVWNGGAIPYDMNVSAYSTSSVPCGSTCASERRTCSDGTLSGSYNYSSCTVGACCDNTCYGCGTYTGCGNYCGDCPPPTYVVYLNQWTGTSCDTLCASHGMSCESTGTDAAGTDNCVNEYGTRGASCYWKECNPARTGYGWVGTPCGNIIYPDDGNHGHAAGSCISGFNSCLYSNCDKVNDAYSYVFWQGSTQASTCPSIGWCGIYFRMSTYCRCYS